MSIGRITDEVMDMVMCNIMEVMMDVIIVEVMDEVVHVEQVSTNYLFTTCKHSLWSLYCCT